MSVPIDHCLVSPEITILDRRLGPAVGSDHYPLIVDFIIS
jgi:endonuclease/exonuclease/phosphatase (EEP) superfamily protein YafD